MKCHIQVLGAPSIWTPAGQLATTKPLVFGAALYLGLNRGKAVRRTHLSALLWPDVSDAARGERSRWLVHQLRRVGLVTQARAPEIELGVHEVGLDVDALAEAESAADALALAHGDVLSGYDPRISDTFSQWIDETRDTQRSRVIRALDGWLATSRRAASWPEVEELARRILALDELHENASVALAEALALNGRRDASMQVLARYRSAAGTDAGMSAARQLQDRLQEVSSDEGAATRRSPLAGRREALATLLDSVDVSGGSRPSSRIGLAGPSGIGKSRLLDELITVAQLRGTRVAHVRCGSADALRPLSLAADVARALLEVRGALGASPTSIETLRAFLGQGATDSGDIPNEARRAAVYSALHDLVGALSDDGPLVVVIDDAQWAEPGSWTILAPLFSQQTTSALSWVIALRAEKRDTVAQSFAAIFPAEGVATDQYRDTIWLTPLERDDVAALCTARVAPERIPPDVLGALVRRAAGIPFIAEALTDHWTQGGDISSIPPSVSRLVSARLDRLSPNAACVLEAIAVLGPDANPGGLEVVCLIERSAMLDATRELETTGILRTEEGRLSAHALWTEAVLARAPRATLQVLHRYVAQWLEHHAAVFQSSDHRRYWAIATHWLDADDPERALRALDRAAEVLSASGFAAHAATMLERCGEISGESEAALRCWTRAAELWIEDHSSEGHNAVARIHAQFDRVSAALNPLSSPHHEIELLAHVAFSQRHVSHNEIIRRYLPCATDTSASPTHRMAAAARILAHTSHGEMDRSMADAAWQAVQSITPATPMDRLEVHVCAALYFARVAHEPASCVESAERAQATLMENPGFGSLVFQRVLLTLAECYEVAGDYERAQATRLKLYEHGEQVRSQIMMMFALEHLIATALEAGRPMEARPFLALFGRPTAETRSQLDRARTIHWVVCALEEGDAAQARGTLDFPLEEANTAPGAMPRARILAIYAHLALLEGDDTTAKQLMPRLLECFSGRMAFMHHPAYVAALCLQRYCGQDSASEFVRRFLGEISLERWAPREALLRLARGEPVARDSSFAELRRDEKRPRLLRSR